MENNDKNLDETKVFKPVNSENDTLEIPSFKKQESKDLDQTAELQDVSDLVDNGSENLKAAEEELNTILFQQTQGADGGDGNNEGDDDMAKKKKKGKFSRLEKFNIFLLSVFSLMVIGVITGTLIFLTLIAAGTDLDIDALANKTQTLVYDKNDELYFDMSMYSPEGEAFSDTPYINITQSAVDAFVAVEDSRFFKHKGFDVPRFTKAIFINVADGGFSQGGSTLTMQLVKTSQLKAEKKLTRKAREIVMSLKLDKALTKDQTFEYYVNKINYGAGNTRGLEGAAQYYFGKSASDLNLSESALLAGVVNLPNKYSPVKNLENAYTRRNTVLDLMLRHGYITEEEAMLAKAVKIENQLTSENIASSSTEENPYIDYINAVIDEVKDVLDVDIVGSPLKVYTNMDPDLQKTISDIQHERNYTYPDDIMQSGIVVGDNDTGAVLAIGGGRDGQVMKGFSRATDMFQQPGSVTKPLLSYALAFEHLGWATSHVVEDKPVQYAGTDKYLGNANGRYQGEVRLKDAVANSLNTPAYITLGEVQEKVGRNTVAQYLRDLGFSKVKDEEYNQQYAIGGSTFQVSPMELFGAQAVMMNGGYYIEPHTVRHVETAKNEIIEDKFESTKVRVISEESAYLVSALEDYNVSSGIINRMEVLGGKGYPVYAKTGTTDYGDTAVHLGIPEGAGKDQWMMASSRKYTSVVWMGFDKPEAGKYTWWTNSKYNANPLGKMNNILLDAAHRGKENPGRVQRPAGISDITHVLSTFPYANPIANMDSTYITSGEINSKYLKLVDLERDNINIEAMSSDFNASYNLDNQQITINWPAYPEGGSIQGSTYDISVGRIKATGTRLFHPSWIFGPVQYKAEIKEDGAVIDTISSGESSTSKSIKLGNGTKVEICGWYGNNQQNGEAHCVTIDNPKQEKDIVLNFRTEKDIDEFVKANDLNRANFIKVDSTNTPDVAKHGLIAGVFYNNNNVNGAVFKQDQLKTMVFTYSIYNYEAEEKPEVPNPGDNQNEKPPENPAGKPADKNPNKKP